MSEKKGFNFLGLNISLNQKEVQEEVQAFVPSRHYTNGSWGVGYSISFDGEKNVGEIGPILDYKLNHSALAARSWQAYLESEIARTVLNRFTVWVVAKGLKLQMSPSTKILQSEGIELDTEKFNDIVESRFSLWSKSKRSSWNGETTFNEISKEVFKHSKIGGDALVVLRYDKDVNVQIIDTYHLSNLVHEKEIGENNTVSNGVEIDENGRHVAYHLKDGTKNKRILAYNSIGLRVAFLVYGSKYRVDNLRGIPAISTSLETLKKVERYKEASVGSAEERSKIPYTIEHDQFSDGENPLADKLANLWDSKVDGNVSIPVDAQGKALAREVASTTNKQVFNMPVGSQLKSLESKNELFFKEFYGTNADIICAAIGIPPNVAFSIYNDSFSASRAATKDWEHTINVERDSFQSQFYDYVLAFWFHIQILKGKIQAPGYLVSFNNENLDVTESYLNARFTGPMFPHIDPLKEVKAEREKLGELAKNIPLTTVEMATEALAGGDSYSNMEQFSEEIKKADEFGLKDKEVDPITE